MDVFLFICVCVKYCGCVNTDYVSYDVCSMRVSFHWLIYPACQSLLDCLPLRSLCHPIYLLPCSSVALWYASLSSLFGIFRALI